MKTIAIAAFLAISLLPQVARAADGCKLSLDYVKSGFFLNPTLEKILVASMKSSNKALDCKLKAGDEILQVNNRDVKGKKANDVMAYWKGLDQSNGLTFKVLRGEQVLVLLVKD